MVMLSQELTKYTNYLYRFQRALKKNRVKKFEFKHQEIVNQVLGKYNTRLLELYNENISITGNILDVEKTQDILDEANKKLADINHELNGRNSRWSSKKCNVDKSFIANHFTNLNLSELLFQANEVDNKIKTDFIWPLLGTSKYAVLEAQRQQLCCRLEELQSSYKKLLNQFQSTSLAIYQDVEKKMFNYYEKALIAQEKNLKSRLKKMPKIIGTFLEPIPIASQMKIGANWTGNLIFQLGYERCENHFETNGQSVELLSVEVPYLVDLSKIDYLAIANEQDVKSLILRILNTLPAGSIKINVYDPQGRGDKINYLFKLGPEMDKLFCDGSIKRTAKELDELLEYEQKHIIEINAKFLSGKYQNLVERNNDVKMSIEPYHIVVFFGSPSQFDRYGNDKQDEFNSLVKNAGKYGVFVIVCESNGSLSDGLQIKHPNIYRTNNINQKAHGFNFDFSFKLTESSVWYRIEGIDPSGEKKILDNLEAKLRNSDKLEVYPETVFKASKKYYQAQLAKGIKETKPISMTAANTWWQKSSINGVEANIGLFLANQRMPITLKINSSADANGLLIGGMSGSGKSNLLDNIIIEFCMRYSPEELNLYLIDMKDGVGMNKYRKLPHIKVLGLESNAEFILGVLGHLKELSEKRNQLFKTTGVDNFMDYRKKTGNTLSRMILVIDEFSLLFKDNDHAEQGIAAIINQMRSQGIHLILAAQQLKTFAFVPEKILKAIPQRIVLRVSDETESHNFLSINNPAAAKIAPDQVGQAIFNLSNGDVSGNQFFQSTFMDDYSVKRALNELINNPTYKNVRPYVYENYLYAKWSDRALKTIRSNTALIGDTMQFGQYGQLVFSEDIPSNVLMTHHDSQTMQNIMLNLLFSLLYSNSHVYYLNLDGKKDITKTINHFKKIDLKNLRIIDRVKSDIFLQQMLSKVKKFQNTNGRYTTPTFVVVAPIEKIRIGSESLDNLNELLERGSEFNLYVIINTQSLTSSLKRFEITYNLGKYFSQIIASDLNEIKVPKVSDNEKQTLIYDSLHEVAIKVRVFDAFPLSNFSN